MGWFARFMEHWRAERARYYAPPPPPPLPDWSAIADYYALNMAICGAAPMTPDVFLDGPFTRFLQLGSNDDHPRARARAMEFGKGALDRYRARMIERGEAVAEFDARAWALAHSYFDTAPSGDYMLEVLEGRATHNYRAPGGRLTRDDSSTLPPPSPGL